MRKVSNEFIDLSKKIKIQDLKLTINEGELTVQEVHLMPVNIFNSIPINILRARKQVIAKELTYGFEGQLFKAIMQQIEITVKNASEIKGKYVDFQYGIQINNKFEYVNMGEYYIKDVEDDKNKEELVVTGYDKMLNFMKPFKQSELQLVYPCKMSQLVNRMGEVCEVELYSADFFNSDLIVDEDFFTAQQLTYRDVLEKVAQTTLTTIFIKENKLYLCKIGDSVQTLDTSFLSNLVVGEKFGPVNALVLGRGSVEDNIESVNQDSINTYGRCEIRFDENEFVDSKREEVIDLMLQQIDGLEYYAIEASNLGLLWLEPCDVIISKDREDNPYKSIYLKARVTINTGIKGEMEAEIPDTTTTEYKVTTKEEKKTLKVERLAKKNEGLIQDVIEQQTETGEKLSKVEQTVDGITETIKSVETKVETVQSTADNAQTAVDEIKTKSVQKVDVMYALSNSSTEAPTSGWHTTAPAWENGKYMWQKTVTMYADGTSKESDATCITGATGKTGENGKDGANGTDGEKGDTGIGVKSIEEQYYLSTSNTSQTGGSWKTTQDTWVSGKYIWTRNKITWTDNTITYTTAILATGLNNANATANTANNTANTANTNAQNAQETANENTTKIETTTTKLVEVEKTVDGISQKVKNIEVVTNTVSGTKTLELENCVAGSLLELHIHGNNEVFNNQDSLIKVHTRNICPTQIKDWEQGSFSGSTGETMTYSNSLRLVNMIEIDNTEITLSVQDNNYCLYFIYIYDSDKNYLGGYSSLDGQKTGTIKLASKTKYMNITLKREDGAVINPVEIANIKPQIEYGSEKTEFIEHNTQLIELGVTEVLRKNDEVEDEYILSNGQAQVIRKVNADGTTKATPTTEDLGGCNVSLAEGTNTIEIKNYTANMEAKYVIKNAYTDTFATKVETESSITQTAEKINIEVRKKVDENEIISSINQSPEQITIQAEKININGTVSANGNFKVDTEGNMECTNATINGGKITLTSDTSSGAVFRIKDSSDISQEFSLSSTGMTIYGGASNELSVYCDSDGNVSISLVNGEGYTGIAPDGITTPTVTQTSLAEEKKNFEKLQDNAIDIIKKIDIYKYNLKSENDTDKKHIGFVIGEDYNYSEEVTSLDNKGVDNYSFTSLCCKALQEQQEMIESLQKQIKELKEGK